MAIYSLYGGELEVIADCGQHHAASYPRPVRILRVTWKEDGKARHVFAHYLRADGGIKEIHDAAIAAPKVELSGTALKNAIAEAD
jgi:hypothetical protein